MSAERSGGVRAVGGGAPSPQELAAIVAAVEAAWPRAVVVTAEDVAEPPRWRFSGRWWSRPVTSRRMRPW